MHPKIALLFMSIIQGVQSRTRGKVCPVLGPSFPQPSNINSFETFRQSMKQLDEDIDHTLQTGSNKYGTGPYNGTTFSISLFSTYDDGLIYQRHHTSSIVADSPVGTHHVDADTVYQIGSISKLLTMYLLLILDGDKSYNEPITRYLPELAKYADAASAQYGALPKWHEITIGDLGTHIAGIEDDYGLDDAEFYGSSATSVYGSLPTGRVPTCNYPTGYAAVKVCTTKELIKGLSTEPALFASGITPSYSNAGYDLIGAVIESISGVPLSHSFQDSFVRPLGLSRTFFYPPKNASIGAVPISTTRSGWNARLGPTIPDGGYYTSSNDFAMIGKSILNSTLLPISLTRRWLKPRTFTSDPTNFVGAPWEIYRWETPNRLYDIYTKEGEEGVYATMFGVIPDLGLGFSALTAARYTQAGVVEDLANIIADAALPAVQEVARQQAHQNFVGLYSMSKGNSSVAITTDEKPGLRVTEWINNGTDVLASMGSNYDFRLWPNELYSGDRVGFTMSMESLLHKYAKRPLKLNCETWVDTGGEIFGDVALGAFVFKVDQDGKAKYLKLEALSLTLNKD